MLNSLVLPLAFATLAAAQSSVYYFTGAIEVTPANTNPSAAVPAVCPADHPVSCNSIQQPYYCCPASNYCSWANSVVACCPEGQTCSGAANGAGWQPTTTTYYTQPAPTVVVVPAAVTTQYTTAASEHTTTQAYYGNGQYCSTIVEVGPNLPTTAAGNCGTILIVPPASKAARRFPDWLRLLRW